MLATDSVALAALDELFLGKAPDECVHFIASERSRPSHSLPPHEGFGNERCQERQGRPGHLFGSSTMKTAVKDREPRKRRLFRGGEHTPRVIEHCTYAAMPFRQVLPSSAREIEVALYLAHNLGE